MSAVRLNSGGTVDNTGNTLTLDAATGSWLLNGGTLRGGTLALSGGPQLVFTSSGGTLLLFASGSGFRNNVGGILGMRVLIDNMEVAAVKAFTNEASSHKAFPPSFSVVTSIGAGSHTLDLIPLDANTRTDVNDYFNVMVLELPFR